MSAVMQWNGRLGVPYQGSKNQIAKEIISILPRGKRFVDLFAGGCAMTHAAMISGKYDTFLANDLHGFGLRLFIDAIAGKCNGRWRDWVSREEFFAKRDKDPLVALCWSFGNNQATYLYAEDKIAEKHKAHLERLKGCQSLVQVESLERLQALERTYADFVTYADGDVVYCDIPYKSATEAYRFMKRNGITFDYDAFYEWALTRNYPVFVSEYDMPKGFTCIWEKNKKAIMNHYKDGGYGNNNERVYVADRYSADYQTDLFLGLKDEAR